MAPVLQSEAMSHNESEPDYEAIPRDEAGVLGDSHDDIWSFEYVRMYIELAPMFGTYVGFLQWT